MKREQEEVALGPQSPLPWLDELLPSACDGAWAPDNIFNFDGNTTARDENPQSSQGAPKRIRRSTAQADEDDLDGDDGEEYGQAAMGGRRRGAGVKSIKADREKARRQRESDSLIELSKLLDAGQNARRDKLSVLTDAIKEVTRLRSEAISLHRLNKILEERLQDMKAKQQESAGVQQAPQLQPMQPPGMLMQQYFSQPVPVTQLQQPPAPADAAAQAPPIATQPQQPYPQPPMQQGLVAIPAAMLQQMLAAHQQRMEAAAKAMQSMAVPAQQQAAVVKVEGAPDTLSAAACLYMPSADLDVSADGVKRPPAA